MVSRIEISNVWGCEAGGQDKCANTFVFMFPRQVLNQVFLLKMGLGK